MTAAERQRRSRALRKLARAELDAEPSNAEVGIVPEPGRAESLVKQKRQ
jgi:hypothetical protein